MIVSVFTHVVFYHLLSRVAGFDPGRVIYIFIFVGVVLRSFDSLSGEPVIFCDNYFRGTPFWNLTRKTKTIKEFKDFSGGRFSCQVWNLWVYSIIDTELSATCLMSNLYCFVERLCRLVWMAHLWNWVGSSGWVKRYGKTEFVGKKPAQLHVFLKRSLYERVLYI